MAFAACSGKKTVTRRLLRLKGPEPDQLGHGAYILRPLRETDSGAADCHWSFFLSHDPSRRAYKAPVIHGPIVNRPVTILTTWAVAAEYDELAPSELPNGARGKFWHAGMSRTKPPDGLGRLRSGRFLPSLLRPLMPRIHIDASASVERLHAITEEDAKAEGVEAAPTHIDGFRSIFARLNGRGSWAGNPLVWRIPFKLA
jgi:hypothetical protein